jgi:hypothetical protein
VHNVASITLKENAPRFLEELSGIIAEEDTNPEWKMSSTDHHSFYTPLRSLDQYKDITLFKFQQPQGQRYIESNLFSVNLSYALSLIQMINSNAKNRNDSHYIDF